MKLLSFLVAILVMLPSTDKDGVENYWDKLLDRYEALCNACLEKRSNKEIHRLSEDINNMLKHPEGKMTDSQRKRFTAIQNKYKGFITISDKAFSEAEPPRIIKVDTVRRYEHIKVTDTVFVKEVLGSIEIKQQFSHTDTVYHIIQYQAPPQLLPQADSTAAKEVPPPQAAVGRNVAARPEYLVLADAGFSSTLSFGATMGVMDKWGGYAGFRSSFRKIEEGYSCTSDGRTSSGTIMTNGKAARSRFVVSAGACRTVNKWMVAYAGAGYGSYSLYWQDVDGAWANVSDISVKGPEFEAGSIFHLGGFAISLGVSTTSFRYADIKLGLGVIF